MEKKTKEKIKLLPKLSVAGYFSLALLACLLKSIISDEAHNTVVLVEVLDN